MRETEVRDRLSDADAKAMATALDERGFQNLGVSHQIDVMFDYPDASIFKSGSKIRIRREDGRMELTYKGGMLGRSDVSDRAETIISISESQFEECKVFLEAI